VDRRTRLSGRERLDMAPQEVGTGGPEKGPAPTVSGGRRSQRPLPKSLKRRVVPVTQVLNVEREVLAALPSDFLHRYEQVWLQAFGAALGGRGSAAVNPVASTSRVVRMTTGQTETRGGAKSGKKLAGASDKNIVSSERALEFKRSLDADLRKVNRRMRVWLSKPGDKESMGRRCSVCKRFGDDEWVYCPRDGKPMEERDA
jgi:hypothetical protein